MTNVWRPVLIAGSVAVPGVILEFLARFGGVHIADPLAALLFGIAIIGSAFLLSWAAEVLQLDVSAGLALALLALIAILPEYVVDATFAWKAAEDPEQGQYAVANMTGANRLLIGMFWPLVVGIIWYRTRHRVVQLDRSNGLELITLLAATVYAFVIPIKGTLSWVDFVVLVSLFIAYIFQLAKLPAEEPHLLGPAQAIGAMETSRRRRFIAIMGIGAALVILWVAEPFGQSLINTGSTLGISEFLLVQWLAPLASEAPELVVVCIFAWRGAATTALGALVSSKINQWTLLIAMLPLIYSVASGGLSALELETLQREEVLLTAAQSLFAVIILLDLRLGLPGALALFTLFATQLGAAILHEAGVVGTALHWEISILYIVLAAVALIYSRRDIWPTILGVRAFLAENAKARAGSSSQASPGHGD